jgi:hypothetical protein
MSEEQVKVISFFDCRQSYTGFSLGHNYCGNYNEPPGETLKKERYSIVALPHFF